MNSKSPFPLLVSLAFAMSALFGSGCNPGGNPAGGGGGAGNGGSGGGTGGGSTLLNDASGYDGSISGKVLDQQSTRASTVDGSAAQDVPPDFDTESASVEFFDVAGDPLLDETGQPIEAVPLSADGTFTAEGLPVGADFAVCVDIGSDGSCDVESCVNIPNDDPNAPGVGHVDDVKVDPLTTVVLAKLHALVEERGIDPSDLPISPVALVTRIVDAYIHLFEETGTDATITLEDIEALSDEQLAQLFDEAVPALAQSGMLAARGNLGLVKAADVNAAALAAAEIFLQAGFPIADGPDPLDLSSLGDIADVESKPMSQLRPQGEPLNEPFVESNDNVTVAPAQFDGFVEPTVYFSTVAEPDRNFSDDEADAESNQGPRLPVIHDYLLVQMARMHIEKRSITIAALHNLLTSLEDGMGARLTYFVHDPTKFGPPATVFETRDGTGKAVRIDELFSRIQGEGFAQLNHEDLQRREVELRAMLRELLSDTVSPELDRLAGAFLSDRVASAAELAAHIRDSRVHLPFSRTGPSTFFVVADGDPLRGDAVSPVTVDADVTARGTVGSVTYNADGTGKFYLMFTQGTQGEGIVGLMVRDAGRMLHGPRGPVRLNMNDATIFQPVNGAPFAEFVAETGSFFPGVNISVVSTTFVPQTSDPNAVAPAEDVSAGPNRQIFVLATSPGPGGEPVKVDYDMSTGIATYNSAGRFLLQFTPETQDTGTFLLFNESTGRPAGQEDPVDFFVAPPPNDLVTVDPNLPPDGTLPTDGTQADTTAPPQDGSVQPAQLADATGTTGEPLVRDGQILVSVDTIVGLPISRQTFTHVFGTEVANPRYNADGDPYYDDINADGVQGADEPTTPFRPTLFNPSDWRSTDIRMYYRRADNNASVTFEEVAFDSQTPQTRDGIALVARNLQPRLNAFRFGRPNTAINLLTAFLPPAFFDGTHAFNADTKADVLGAIAIINLMMDQAHNVQAIVDIDGPGPLQNQSMLLDAHIFIPPVGDPFVLMLKGFASRAVLETPSEVSTSDAATDSTTDATTDSTSTDTPVDAQ